MPDPIELVPPMQRWGWPPSAKRPHYFIDGDSLCGRIKGYRSGLRSWVAPEPDTACGACGRKLGRWLAEPGGPAWKKGEPE